MRITLDTDNKIVTLLHQVSWKEIDQIKKMLGDGWKEWNITPYYYNPYPYIQQFVSWDTPTTGTQPLATFTAQ